jgi:hypothetical protein
MTQQIQLTLTGATYGDIMTQVQALASEGQVKTKAKKVETEDDFNTAETSYADSDFDTETTAPAKTTKTAKTKKYKLEDVNAAAKAYAKRNGRDATLAILRDNFETTSITELTAAQYAEAIELLG